MRQYRLQRRQHPIFSPVAIVSTLIFVVGLGTGVYLTGGRAFSPGDLSAINNNGAAIGGFLAHADFSDDCAQCHTPFQGVTAERCETCHENLFQERQTGAGLHGSFGMARECGRCHPDHRGADFDLAAAALTYFDHDVTDFSLAQHPQDYTGAAMICAACHVSEADFTISATACADCHGADAPEFMVIHTEAFGGDCLRCHDGIDTLANFTAKDHTREFALTGAHAEALCESCHAGGKFDDITERCAGCHAEPAAHNGLFGADCVDCHTTDGWTPATMDGSSFDHARDTRFSLLRHATNYDDAPLTCRVCHTGEQFTFAETECADCHATAQPEFIIAHATQVGANCLSCHDGSGEITNFDHSLVWPLTGKHLTADCTSCHIDQVFSGTSRECVACHAEPDVHKGVFGVDCAACHTSEAWQPARLTQHTFPLNHGQSGEIACATCHPTTYTEYTCYGCHEHDPAKVEREHREEGIRAAELPDCARCHPTGREEEGEDDD